MNLDSRGAVCGLSDPSVEVVTLDSLNMDATQLGMLPEEFQLYIKKELTEFPDLDEVFEHFDESPMAELDDQIPDEFWVDFELQQLVRRNRKDFESMESAN
jgi:hypothetical protein